VLPLVWNVDSDVNDEIETVRMSHVNRARIRYFEDFNFHQDSISNSSFKLDSSSTSARYSSIFDFMGS
jgi:hypothetical protein